MCKILILLGMGLMFIGCNQSQLEPKSSDEDINTARKSLLGKKYAGCRLLASGYLVCPKIRY